MNGSTPIDTGALLVDFMRRMELTQVQLAALLGTEQTQISRWKRNVGPSNPILFALALRQLESDLRAARLRAAATEMDLPAADDTRSRVLALR